MSAAGEPALEPAGPSAVATFPTRAFFQPGFMVEIQEELRGRGVAVRELSTAATAGKPAIRREMETLGLGARDLVAGIPWYVELAFEVMGLPAPPLPDYPACLAHLLRRRMWQSTLGQVEANLAAGTHPRIFIKPAEGAKGFSGAIVTGPVDDLLSGEFGFLSPEIFPNVADSGGREAPVHCSEVLDMNSEYAVYVVEGAIRKVCHYMCKRSTCRCAAGEMAAAGQPVLALDMAVVEDAVERMSASEEMRALAGYRADFVLAKRDGEARYETTLCEVNDGYVSGRYDDCPPADFTDMLVARFAALQRTRGAPPPAATAANKVLAADRAAGSHAAIWGVEIAAPQPPRPTAPVPDVDPAALAQLAGRSGLVGGSSRGGVWPAAATAPPPTALADAPVDEVALVQLISMGFDQAKSEAALRACGGSLEHATEWIFSHMDD
jgi:hypothetical protein